MNSETRNPGKESDVDQLTERIIGAALLFNFATTRLTIKRVGREFHSRAIEEDLSL
ncbi:MAG: hypothetical protein ACJ8KU_07790 [Chthoniobacterales bacterium]